jgi:hypothetical protein
MEEEKEMSQPTSMPWEKWITSRGKVMSINDMSEHHVRASLNMLLRMVREQCLPIGVIMAKLANEVQFPMPRNDFAVPAPKVFGPFGPKVDLYEE